MAKKAQYIGTSGLFIDGSKTMLIGNINVIDRYEDCIIDYDSVVK